MAKAKSGSKSKAKRNSLTEYERKRDFAKTSEPSPRPRRKAKPSPKRRHPPVHDPEARGHLAALRPPARGRRRPRLLGGPEGDLDQSGRQAAATRGSPDGVVEFEGVIPKGEYGAAR